MASIVNGLAVCWAAEPVHSQYAQFAFIRSNHLSGSAIPFTFHTFYKQWLFWIINTAAFYVHNWCVDVQLQRVHIGMMCELMECIYSTECGCINPQHKYKA